MEKSTFNRNYSDEQIATLIKEKEGVGYINKLFCGMKNGNILFTCRPNNKCSFYYKGRNICDISELQNFVAVIDPLYLPIAKSRRNEISEGLTENAWQEKCKMFDHTFEECYEEIIENADMKADLEAIQVSGLYKFSPFSKLDSEIILLDIESKFSYSNASINDKRIDVVLYHKRLRQLIFIEVKRLADDRLQKKGELQQEIIDQMDGYKSLIECEHDEIVIEFNKSISAINQIGNYTIPEIDNEKDILLGLLISEYSSSDIKLVKQLSKEISYPVVSIGNVSNCKAETLVEWINKLKRG